MAEEEKVPDKKYTPPIKVNAYKAAPITTVTDLLKAGFILQNTPPPHRLIVAVGGLGKSGKTHFALSAPPPIYYFQFDIGGEEGVIDLAGPEVYLYKCRAPQGATQDQCMKAWQKFMELVIGIYGMGIGTVVIDTWDGAYVLAQMGYMGKLTQNNRPGYGIIYADLFQVRDAAFASETMDTILLNKVETGFTSGKQEFSGYKDTKGMVLEVLETYREDKKGEIPRYGVRLLDSRRNAALPAGTSWEDGLANFQYVKEVILAG